MFYIPSAKNVDGKRQRKPPVRFRPAIDIALMQSTLDSKAILVRYGSTKSTWDRVADAVNVELQKLGTNDLIDSRRCQDRVKRLMDLFREQNFKAFNRGGTPDEYKRQIDLLQQLVAHEDERKKAKARPNPPMTTQLMGMIGSSQGELLVPGPSPALLNGGMEYNTSNTTNQMEMMLQQQQQDIQRAAKQRKLSPDDILSNAIKASELFEKFLLVQQSTLEQTRNLLSKQVELEERRLKLEEDKLNFARQQQAHHHQAQAAHQQAQVGHQAQAQAQAQAAQAQTQSQVLQVVVHPNGQNSQLQSNQMTGPQHVNMLLPLHPGPPHMPQSGHPPHVPHPLQPMQLPTQVQPPVKRENLGMSSQVHVQPHSM